MFTDGPYLRPGFPPEAIKLTLFIQELWKFIKLDFLLMGGKTLQICIYYLFSGMKRFIYQFAMFKKGVRLTDVTQVVNNIWLV